MQPHRRAPRHDILSPRIDRKVHDGERCGECVFTLRRSRAGSRTSQSRLGHGTLRAIRAEQDADRGAARGFPVEASGMRTRQGFRIRRVMGHVITLLVRSACGSERKEASRVWLGLSRGRAPREVVGDVGWSVGRSVRQAGGRAVKREKEKRMIDRAFIAFTPCVYLLINF